MTRTVRLKAYWRPMMSTRTPQVKAPAVRPAEKAEKILPDWASDHVSLSVLELTVGHAEGAYCRSQTPVEWLAL